MLAQLAAVASIPSPAGDSLHIGPLEVRSYGLIIGLGVVVAVWIAQRRWVARGGDPDDIVAIAAWAVPAGVVGARLYHVVTDFTRFEGRWWHIPAIWEGGLGIPGGIAAGVATYHPTFLYEALWNLVLAAVLVWVGRRWHPRSGQLFAGYVAGYAGGRFWVESLRIDPATELLGIRVNLWVSAVVFVAAVAVLAIGSRDSRDRSEPDARGATMVR